MTEQYCVRVKMSHFDSCQDQRVFEELEFCGDNVGDAAVDFRDNGFKGGHKLEEMDRYFKDEADNKRMINKPPAWCGWIAFEGNCWNRVSVVEEPKIIEDENSVCYERVVFGLFESTKEWFCLPKND